jgi:GAF domain-containing protein
MSSTQHRVTLDEQSFQSLLWAAFTIQEHNDRKLGDTSSGASEEPAELLHCVPDHLLKEMVRQAHQATGATSAAIALKWQGKLICQAAAGDSPSEIGAMIETGTGFTGLCASSGILQLCSNAALSSHADADACQKLGIRALIAAPIFHEDRPLGLIAVFSTRPYAFGMRDVQALQDLAEKFTLAPQVSTEPAKANTAPHPPGIFNLSH